MGVVGVSAIATVVRCCAGKCSVSALAAERKQCCACGGSCEREYDVSGGSTVVGSMVVW